jgi:HAMP domain-containing protein
VVRLRVPANLAVEFGSSGEALVTDPELEPDLRLAEERYRRELRTQREELDELVEAYGSLWQESLDDGAAWSEAERERALDRLEEFRQEYAQYKSRHDRWAAMLATVLVIRALRETGEGVPAPEAAEEPIRTRLADSMLDDRRLVDLLRAVRRALNLDPDPLAWVPDEGPPEHIPPHGPVPGANDPTWELPAPEPADEESDPVELMDEIADGELDPDELDDLDDTL